jgi:hypothetical protein
MLEAAGVAIHVTPVTDHRTNGAIMESARGDSLRSD